MEWTVIESKTTNWLKRGVVIQVFISGPTTYYFVGKVLGQGLGLFNLSGMVSKAVYSLIDDGILTTTKKECEEGIRCRKYLDLTEGFLNALHNELDLELQVINALRGGKARRVSGKETKNKEYYKLVLKSTNLIDLINTYLYLASRGTGFAYIIDKALTNYYTKKLPLRIAPFINILIYSVAKAKGISATKRRVNLGQKKERKHGIELGR